MPHVINQRVEAIPLPLYAAEYNFDFFFSGSEMNIAIFSDRQISDMVFLDTHSSWVSYSNIKWRWVWGQDKTNSSVWDLERRSLKGWILTILREGLQISFLGWLGTGGQVTSSPPCGARVGMVVGLKPLPHLNRVQYSISANSFWAPVEETSECWNYFRIWKEQVAHPEFPSFSLSRQWTNQDKQPILLGVAFLPAG